jgi:NgoMIV restriction enzyme
MRRDRAQNTRLEALNLVRNRKGRLPHVAAVTMECDPEILASLCLGTGDIDCVSHAALHELIEAAEDAANTMPPPRRGATWPEKLESLRRMVDGSRLRDVSDLPLDLMI